MSDYMMIEGFDSRLHLLNDRAEIVCGLPTPSEPPRRVAVDGKAWPAGFCEACGARLFDRMVRFAGDNRTDEVLIASSDGAFYVGSDE